MNSGILLLDKPAGVSSAGAIATVRKKLKIEKIGHCGTLDPMATGLLVVLVNSATRLADYIQEGKKVYSGTIRLGLTTDSDDIEGRPLSTCENRPAFEAVRRAAARLTGEINQIPPQVSALKVNGERAYERARRGQTTELKARKVSVFSFDVWERGADEAGFKVCCSRGTYIRSLARDIGEILGCGACLSSLRREESAPFCVSDARTIQNIQTQDLLGWERALPGALVLELEQGLAMRVGGGDLRAVKEAADRIATVDKASKSAAIEGVPEGPMRFAIYKEAITGRAGGLLVNDGSGWRIGFNVSAGA